MEAPVTGCLPPQRASIHPHMYLNNYNSPWCWIIVQNGPPHREQAKRQTPQGQCVSMPKTPMQIIQVGNAIPIQGNSVVLVQSSIPQSSEDWNILRMFARAGTLVNILNIFVLPITITCIIHQQNNPHLKTSPTHRDWGSVFPCGIEPHVNTILIQYIQCPGYCIS